MASCSLGSSALEGLEGALLWDPRFDADADAAPHLHGGSCGGADCAAERGGAGALRCVDASHAAGCTRCGACVRGARRAARGAARQARRVALRWDAAVAVVAAAAPYRFWRAAALVAPRPRLIWLCRTAARA
jgi:hypothetical protein